MSNEITTARVQEYTQGVYMLAQQKMSRLRRAVRTETVMGKSAYFDQIGATTLQKRTTRHGDTPLIETPHSRRRVDPAPYEGADLIDDPDKVRTLNDWTNPYTRAFAAASGRAMDQAIIDVAFAASNTGEDGSTSVSFPTSTHQIVSGSAGLSVVKLRTAKRILDENEVDPDLPRYLACSAKQIDDMLGETEATSSDFATVKALAQGEINSFMGFEFIRTELLGTATAERRCIAWSRDSLLLGISQEPRGRISERADKSYSTQVYYSMDIGATRMDETGVVEILCTE